MSYKIFTEKFRPKLLNEVVGQTIIMQELKSMVEKGNIPHLLFYGPAGVGKTTSAYCIGREIYREDLPLNFLELNASDERGIDVVRGKIKNFAKSIPVNANFKIIFLDEVDNMTNPAQQALRRTMEKYSNSCRFILSCNNIASIIHPLFSRCVSYEFHTLKDEEIMSLLKRVCEKENIQYTEEGLKYIIDSSNGDIRNALLKLQSVSGSNNTINIETIKQDKFEGTFLFIVKSLFVDKDRLKSLEGIKKYLQEGGKQRELIKRLHSYMLRKIDLPNDKIYEISKLLRDADRDLILGVNPHIIVQTLNIEIIQTLT